MRIIPLFFLLISLLADSIKADDFSHRRFDKLLQNNVKNGLINYGGFDTKDFYDYIESLKNADLSSMNKNQKLAFWINAYNALTIKNVLDHPGMKSPIKVDSFFTKEKFIAAGRKVSLDEIEHEIIRKDFKEPLIHFGLVCAAKGCPKIRDEAYSGENVIENLKENARNYFRTDRGFILDRKNLKVKLTSLMKWFKEDFGEKDKDLLDFIVPYIPTEEALFISENRNNLQVDFIEYNWDLNSQ